MMNDIAYSICLIATAVGFTALGMLLERRKVNLWRERWIELEHDTARQLGGNPRKIDEVFPTYKVPKPSSIKLEPQEFYCKKCDSSVVVFEDLRHTDYDLWQCSNNQCEFHISVRAELDEVPPFAGRRPLLLKARRVQVHGVEV